MEVGDVVKLRWPDNETEAAERKVVKSIENDPRVDELKVTMEDGSWAHIDYLEVVKARTL